MKARRSYVLQAFIETPWAILPSKLALLEEIVIRHISGEKLEAEEIQARMQGADVRPQNRQVKSIAVLPLFGTIIPRADYFEESSGATSAEKFGAQFAELMADPSIDAIILDVNSPGGQVGGIQELSQQIYAARGTKPIIAVANQLMASAAYWIGTAADELVITPSGEVGSIGVFAVHKDMSAALEKVGMKMSLVSAGKFKVEGNPYEPLTDEARGAIQSSVNDFYTAFVDSVARNRGVDPDAVRNGFGEGRVVGARQAVELGMADRVGTLEETVNRLLGRNVPAGSLLSSADTGRSEAAQEPAADTNHHTQEARARLASVGSRAIEGDSTMLRNLLKARADKVARAQAIVDAADKDERDLTEEERAEFAQLLGEGDSTGEIGALDVQIEKVQDERTRLRSAAEKKFSASEPVKPDGKGSNTMKRAEFDKLDPGLQAAFAKGGGKIED